MNDTIFTLISSYLLLATIPAAYGLLFIRR